MGTANNIDAFNFPTGAVFEPERFDRPDLGVVLEPSFRINAGDRVFAMGSCFALRIMEALRASGFDATDAGLDLKYNAMAMLQEVRWCLRGGFDASLIARTTDSKWFNGHRHPARPKDSLEDALAAHLEAQKAGREALLHADVVVLTFGLVEAWLDRQTGAWLNETPARSVPDHASRYGVHRLNHAQCKGAMVELITEIHNANPRAKFLCSVSPIPLKATFFGPDVLVSNAYSKSTQRSALQEALDVVRAAGGPLADYFPSYELVTLAPARDRVWERTFHNGAPDGRHVRPDFVRDSILPVFKNAYVSATHGAHGAAAA